MSRKGKYNLFSFMIEDKLIFYKSINKSKKLVAFSIFRANNVPKIVNILNGLLKKRLLKSYSIQIDISDNYKKLFFLNFEDQERERILNSFNLIFNKLTKKNKFIYFYRTNSLKRHFFKTITANFIPNSKITHFDGSILIKTQDNEISLQGFEIKTDFIKNRRNFLHTLIKLIRNLNHSGFFIFYISINNDNQIRLNAYFIDIIKEKFTKSFNIEKEINSIYKENVFQVIALELSSIYRILWRINLTEVFTLQKEIAEFFISFSLFDFQNLLLFSKQFEQFLKLHQIEVYKLNRKLMLLEKSVLFLIIEKLDFDLIEKILTKYLSTHPIFILVLSSRVDSKILELNNINSIKNLILLNDKDIINFDFSKIKKYTG
jgi:hypothetical protein